MHWKQNKTKLTRICSINTCILDAINQQMIQWNKQEETSFLLYTVCSQENSSSWTTTTHFFNQTRLRLIGLNINRQVNFHFSLKTKALKMILVFSFHFFFWKVETHLKWFICNTALCQSKPNMRSIMQSLYNILSVWKQRTKWPPKKESKFSYGCTDGIPPPPKKNRK